MLKSTAVPLMKKFGIDGEGFELKVRTNGCIKRRFSPVTAAGKQRSLLLLPQVVKRGMAPGGGGEVFFTCPIRRTIRPVQLTDPGKIKRIRGVAYPPQAPSLHLQLSSGLSQATPLFVLLWFSLLII